MIGCALFPSDLFEADGLKRMANSLMDSARVMIVTVPVSADRMAALRKLRDAGYDCNQAITRHAKY